MKSVWWSVLILVMPSAIANPSCELQCENGGHCRLMGTEDDYKVWVQSGKLFQQCVCPQGYAGMGCELPDLACENDDDQCRCKLYDHQSTFAAQMCRKPYTEYCGSDPSFFCTNGGKCKGDLIAAKIAPGDTRANHVYRDEGCICALDFYGPHCEFLRHESRQSPASENIRGEPLPKPNENSVEQLQSNEPSNSNEKAHLPLILVFLMVGAIVAAFFGRRRWQSKQKTRQDLFWKKSQTFLEQNRQLTVIPSVIDHDMTLCETSVLDAEEQRDPLLYSDLCTNDCPSDIESIDVLEDDTDELNHQLPLDPLLQFSTGQMEAPSQATNLFFT